MSVVQTHKRQSKIQMKLSISEANEGLRITIVSKRLGKMALRLREKSIQLETEGAFMTGEFIRLIRALNFRNRDLPEIVQNADYEHKIPNMRFINSEDIINEGIISNVFVKAEILEWIELFQIYVKLMKKYTKRFDLL